MKSTTRTLLIFFLLGFWSNFSWAQTQKEDFSTLLQKAKDGDAEAMFQVARAYEVEQKNVEQAVFWYQKTAEAKSDASGAWHNLGRIYYSEDSGYQNIEKAIYWLTKAGNFGATNAMCILGDLYSKGEYIQADLKNGIKWYEMAANKNSNYASYRLALIYYQEEEYQDFDKAFEWCLKSVSDEANLDNSGLIGKMYYQGDGTEVDKYTGMWYLILAAHTGHSESYEFLKTLGFVD